MNLRNELLTRANNLERYPFESATMAEAGRLAAVELRKIVNELLPAKAATDSHEWRSQHELAAISVEEFVDFLTDALINTTGPDWTCSDGAWGIARQLATEGRLDRVLLAFEPPSAEPGSPIEALASLVDTNLHYSGEYIMVPCGSHGAALERVRKARDVLSKARNEQVPA